MSLFGFFERRNLEDPKYPLTSARLIEKFTGPKTDAGVRVTETSSLRMSAVYRATALISGLGGGMPLHAYKNGTKQLYDEPLLRNPNPYMTGYEYWRLTYVHRCLWGNHFSFKVKTKMSGRIAELHPIPPHMIQVGRASKYIASNPSRKIYKYTDGDGNYHEYTDDEILHIPGLGYDGICGYSPVMLGAQGVGLALAAEEYSARLFGSGALMSGILQTEQRLDQEDADLLQDRWAQKMTGLDNAHKVPVLDSGLSFQSVTMPNDAAQMLESRRFQIAEIARFYGVPLHLLMETEKSTSWGSGMEQLAQEFVSFDLAPQWFIPTEERITKELLVARGIKAYAKYSLEGLLRGDSKSRAEFYRAMREMGVFSTDKILQLEDMEPIGGEKGELLLQPANMVPLGTKPSDLTAQAPPPVSPNRSIDEGREHASQPVDD